MLREENDYIMASTRLRASARRGRRLILLESEKIPIENMLDKVCDALQYDLQVMYKDDVVRRVLDDKETECAMVVVDVVEDASARHRIKTIEYIRKHHPRVPLVVLLNCTDRAIRLKKIFPEVPVVIRGDGRYFYGSFSSHLFRVLFRMRGEKGAVA